MKLALVCLALFGLLACASSQGIVVESRTEPVRLEGDYGPPCVIQVELEGHLYSFTSWVGCYVVRTEVKVPAYHVEGAGRPQ